MFFATGDRSMQDKGVNMSVVKGSRPLRNIRTPFRRVRHLLESLRLPIMDRYMLISFLVPFFLCMFGFIGIWLIYDFGQNGLNLLNELKVPLGAVVVFYLKLLPAVLTLTLPVALLLATLYTLMRMSRRNEILSFLTAGVSLPRLLAPLFVVAFVVTGLSTALNYKLAPNAERISKELMTEFQGRERTLDVLQGVVFRNLAAGRIWYAQRLGLRGDREVRGLQVLILRQDGSVGVKYFAHRGLYNRFERSWHFFGTRRVSFEDDGTVASSNTLGSVIIRGWSETPQQIASSNMKASTMGVEEIDEYLFYNRDFSDAQLAPFRTHQIFRWSAPWICFAVALLSSPLAVVFNRRGMLAGVSAAVVLFFMLWFSSQFFLALGEGNRISPFWAAWAPILIFHLLGLFFLMLKSTNREISMTEFSQPRFWVGLLPRAWRKR